MNKQFTTLGEVLMNPSVHRGWLYLGHRPWTASTSGVFVEFDKDADPDEDPVPEEVHAMGWDETLDVASIEDVVFNASQQLGRPSVDQLVDAFTFYVDNDAFKAFV